MFSWFERRLNPFPTEEPTQAPTGFFAFCWHFTKGATPFIAVTALLMAAIAIAEVWLFGFLGQIVDWLSLIGRHTCGVLFCGSVFGSTIINSLFNN